MKKLADTFFSDTEKKQIESAVRNAESQTSGEIVAMVVDSSDSYRDIDTLAGITLAAAVSIVPSELLFIYSDALLGKVFPSLGWMSKVPDSARFTSALMLFIVLTVILHIPFKLITANIPKIKRLLVPLKRIDFEVRERALRAFHEHGLSATRDATGVLFLLSVLERRVYVLADRGIYEKIKQETLNRYASSISRGIKEGKGCEALCSAINEAGRELGKYFPRKGDDKNELSDSIITER